MITGTTEELLAMLVELSGPCPEICDGTIPLGGSGGTQVVDIRTGIPVTEYPSPSTFLFKDLGFTIKSSDFSSYYYGPGITPNGTSGFTSTGGYPGGKGFYGPHNFGSKYTEIFTYFTDNGLLTNSTSYIFNVTWGAGSSIYSGIALLALDNTTFFISPIYTGDNNWQTPGQDIYSTAPINLAGTFNFPATFTLYKPVIQDTPTWC